MQLRIHCRIDGFLARMGHVALYSVHDGTTVKFCMFNRLLDGCVAEQQCVYHSICGSDYSKQRVLANTDHLCSLLYHC